MAEKVPQTYANHGRLDPPFHFFLLPVAGISVVLAVWGLISNPGGASAWAVLGAAAFVVGALKIRLYALKVQDRVIRLEERLRLATLLPEALRSRWWPGSTSSKLWHQMGTSIRPKSPRTSISATHRS